MSALKNSATRSVRMFQNNVYYGYTVYGLQTCILKYI